MLQTYTLVNLLFRGRHRLTVCNHNFKVTRKIDFQPLAHPVATHQRAHQPHTQLHMIQNPGLHLAEMRGRCRHNRALYLMGNMRLNGLVMIIHQLACQPLLYPACMGTSMQVHGHLQVTVVAGKALAPYVALTRYLHSSRCNNSCRSTCCSRCRSRCNSRCSSRCRISCHNSKCNLLVQTIMTGGLQANALVQAGVAVEAPCHQRQ